MNVKISELPEYIGIPQPVGDIPISINGVTYKIKPNLLSNSLLNLDTVLANGNTSGRNINILGVMGDLTSTNILSDTGTSATILDPTIGNLNYYGNFNAYGASLQTKVFDQNGQASSTLIAGMFTSGFSLSRLQNGFNNLSSLRLNNSDDPFLEFGKVGGNYTTLKATWGGSNIDQTFLLPNKGSGTYTLATLNDISGGGGSSNIQQVLDNGNTTQTGLIFNVASENFGVQLNLNNANSSGIGIQTNSGLAGATPISISNENEQIFNVDNIGNVTAKAIIKDGGTSSQFLMADGSVSSGGTPPINAYSFLANNTNASATPTEQTFENLTNQTYSGNIVWTGGSAPSGTTEHTYSLSQIGNLVTLIINLSYGTAGGATLTAVACELPSTAPTPTLPTSVSAVGEVLNYGSGLISALKTANTVFNSVALRIKSTGVYEVAVTRTVGVAAKQAYITIQYFV